MSLMPDHDRRTFMAATASLFAIATCPTPLAAQGETVEVETAHGRLRGLRRKGAVSFRGVNYAADTSGANRFMAPRPVPSWTGVREAFEVGDRSPQALGRFLGDEPAFVWYGQSAPFSENCCVLNVFTPDLDAGVRRPVMFWMHGGGYSGGGGGSPILDGSNLARFGDVVVVTLNHRLGAFGYTDLAAIGGERYADAANAGQLDLIAALEWVRTNIVQFGGDPGNVTIFGQSGGGSKAMVLMAMPAARGLFHRAINLSGPSGMRVAPAGSTQPYVEAFLRTLGIDHAQLDRLAEVPVEAIVAARAAAVAETGIDGTRPVIDGRHLPTSALAPEGLAINRHIPLMLGTTDTEATMFFRDDPSNFTLEEAELNARIRNAFGMDEAQAAALIAAFRAEDPQRSPSDVLAAIASDVRFRVPIIHAADARARAEVAPVYLYNLRWHMPGEGGRWRAPHAGEIPFVFGNTDISTALTGTGPEPAAIARTVMTAFVAFARTGDPNAAGVPHWPRYDADTRPTMQFDVQSEVVNDYRRADRVAAEPLVGQERNGALLRSTVPG